MTRHYTRIEAIKSPMMGVSGYIARCSCGWRDHYTISRELADSAARIHKSMASRKAVAR